MRGQVRLRFFALQALSNGSIVAPTQINPGQDTIFQVQDDLIGTKQQADVFAASESAQFRWDGGPWVDAPRGPVLSFCARHPLSTGLWDASGVEHIDGRRLIPVPAWEAASYRLQQVEGIVLPLPDEDVVAVLPLR